MAVSSRIAIALGVGAKVGQKVAERFTAAGYTVAVFSRSSNGVSSTIATLSLSADFTNPKTAKEVFEQGRKKLGKPSVVIYNGTRVAYATFDF